ncbi:Pin2p KNAG_0H03390 [Huiozyma naganishii CBS 8797]|uniref:[PSI+] induction protein 2 n=1 Tax=Huiozyma naganishii (strain ATCC MYA-139 / BCRC 22969 / CBS 8797 / KCTC 17520 / NBRC 10181 / NCYC 3082 / Yp74L-3) TaxID=1071383 RepID=J7RPT3_HUIN7|nr:hypothetical protein KNAG_0H03390 [Kazachstania naganishii CBS 8797]CCK71753.1 hypothetical protein KNAG_0H03390 [Kazachstania naganishii CBS 8797]
MSYSKRGWTDDIKHTTKSFRNWHSCMADKPCKIIAIVGICLAGVLFLWLIGAFITCCNQGASGIGQFCCWCCRSSNSGGTAAIPQFTNARQPPNVVYQPVQPPEQYFEDPRRSAGHGDAEEIFELEQDFDLEDQRRKSKKNQSSYPRDDEIFY